MTKELRFRRVAVIRTALKRPFGSAFPDSSLINFLRPHYCGHLAFFISWDIAPMNSVFESWYTFLKNMD